MSYVEVLVIDSAGDVYHYGEAKNAYRGAMMMWQHLNKKYHAGADMLGDMGPLWRLFRSGRLGRNEDLALGSTYDRVMVDHDLLRPVGSGWIKLGSETGSEVMLQVGALLVEIHAEMPDARGVCFNQTSVGDDWGSIEVEGTCDGYCEEAPEPVDGELVSCSDPGEDCDPVRRQFNIDKDGRSDKPLWWLSSRFESEVANAST